MKVTTFGTRGSIPVSGLQYAKYGGRTTCIGIESECIPKDTGLCFDQGSGAIPFATQLLGKGIKKIATLFSHTHHDHIQGIPMVPHTHVGTEVRFWGPKEGRQGPLEMMRRLMSNPDFPVDFAKVEHRFKCTPLLSIGTQVLVIHPKAGFHLLKLSTYRKYVWVDDDKPKQLPLGDGHYDVMDCIVIFMHKTTHPEYSVSFRVEEKPTGRVFVFLTDHEKTAALSADLIRHVQKAHLLIEDCQYSEIAYVTKGGFGHGTPEYCAELMAAAKVERLGLTHHDPFASDADIDQRVEEARERARVLGITDVEDRIFACADDQVFVI